MKKIISVMALVLVGAILLIGCGGNDASKKVDYSEYPFVNISWTREGEHDSETIRFNADGSFTYSCGCGNPVNDSDLCEGYTYDDAAKTITLKCTEKTDEMITSIKIVKCDENTLQLDFGGEIRTFVK